MRVYINTVFDELYAGQAREVILPGEEGQISLMDFHQPIVCRLTEGTVSIISRQKKEKTLHIHDGVAHMEGNTIKIMAEV